MRTSTAVLLLLLAVPLLSMVAGPSGPPGPAVMDLPQPAASVIARTGDPAPGIARVRGFGGRIVATPGGGRLFTDPQGTALYLIEGGTVRVLLHVGDPIPGGGVVGGIGAIAAGGGSIAALVGVTGGATADLLVRVASQGGVASVEVARGQTVPLRGGPVTVAGLLGPAVDGSGRIVCGILPLAGSAALLRRSPGGATEILIQTGDPLGPSIFSAPLSSPSANASGAVAFDAETNVGTHVLALRAPSGATTLLFTLPATPPEGPLGIAPPAINDAGDVAFLWKFGPSITVRRVAAGVSQTVAEPGSPAPDEGTFTEIDALPPAIDPQGGVVFGALRSSGVGGLYRHRSQPEVVAEEGGDAGDGRQFVSFPAGPSRASPAAAADGSIVFAARDSDGDALYARAAALAVLARAGDPIAGPARFVSFFEFPFPYLGAGPFMAPGGEVIFDARITGGRRGLYARRPGGPVTPVALDGDEAPAGGHFDGQFLAFHSVNDAGVVAFLGATPDTGTGTSLFLFLGPAEGPLARILGVGDPVPGSAARVSGFLPPSQVNAAGAIALPVVLSNGITVLLGWDGAALRRVAAPGDAIPGAGPILQIRTGNPGALLPPILDDAGNVLFGATTAAGAALFEAPLVEGGSGLARRVLGAGDPVEGGVLQPFSLRTMARDAAGRLAFQALPVPGSQPVPGSGFATFAGDAFPLRVASPGDSLAQAGTVLEVRPHVAAAGDEGVVHEVVASGVWLFLAVPRTPPVPGAAFDQVTLVGPGLPSPDGGSYLAPAPIVGGPFPPTVPDRLASDGGRRVAMLTRTTEGPETLVRFDLRPGLAPVADAGPDQTIECAGPEGAVVTLDGSASVDPEGLALEYEWTGPFGAVSGAQPSVSVPLGAWTIVLTVRDAQGTVATDTVTITVRDTLAPAIAVTASPDTIWPPDGSLRPVTFSITVADVCDTAPDVSLDSVVIVDPKGDPSADIASAGYGTDDRQILLRAKRTGGIGGRRYIVTYSATDASGNTAPAAATVLVPQSRGG